jgi:hypothetical protein
MYKITQAIEKKGKHKEMDCFCINLFTWMID